MAADEVIEVGMQVVGELITKALKQELISQGHRASGALINSIQANVVSMLDRIEVQVSYLDYGRNVNTGQPAGTWVPLKDLIKWVQVKGIGQGEPGYPVGIAERIQQAIHREGTPTAGRRERFPGNAGRLTGFQDYTVDENTGKISDNLMHAAYVYAVQILHDMLKETNPIEIKLAS